MYRCMHTESCKVKILTTYTDTLLTAWDRVYLTERTSLFFNEALIKRVQGILFHPCSLISSKPSNA